MDVKKLFTKFYELLMNNKIKYNLKNVHIAILTRDESDGYNYAVPIAIPGAVYLYIEESTETRPFYENGVVYFQSSSHDGYCGELDIALISDWFRVQILKEAKDNNGILVKDVDPVYFALLFEIDGDQKAIRHVFYNCYVSSSTMNTLSLFVKPREDGLIKARSGDSTNIAAYNNWYKSVYIPVINSVRLSSLSIGNLVFSPSFVANTTSYIAITKNDFDVISVTAANGATVYIEVNGNFVLNGAEATWENGKNTVTITVSKTGLNSTIYTIIVIKPAE